MKKGRGMRPDPSYPSYPSCLLRSLLVGGLRRAAAAGALDGELAVGERPGLGALALIGLGGDDQLAAVPLRSRLGRHLAHLDLALAAIQFVGRGHGTVAALALDRERVGRLLHRDRTAAAAAAAATAAARGSSACISLRRPRAGEIRLLRVARDSECDDEYRRQSQFPPHALTPSDERVMTHAPSTCIELHSRACRGTNIEEPLTRSAALQSDPGSRPCEPDRSQRILPSQRQIRRPCRWR